MNRMYCTVVRERDRFCEDCRKYYCSTIKFHETIERNDAVTAHDFHNHISRTTRHGPACKRKPGSAILARQQAAGMGNVGGGSGDVRKCLSEKCDMLAGAGSDLETAGRGAASEWFKVAQDVGDWNLVSFGARRALCHIRRYFLAAEEGQQAI